MPLGLRRFPINGNAQICGTILEPMGSAALHAESAGNGSDDGCEDLKQLLPGRI